MKKLAIFTITIMIFSSGAVLACGGSCGDKDKDDQAFTLNMEYLCGGSCGDKKSDKDASFMCGGSCGGGKDKEETKA